jgi:type VI secretion system protein ImpD
MSSANETVSTQPIVRTLDEQSLPKPSANRTSFVDSIIHNTASRHADEQPPDSSQLQSFLTESDWRRKLLIWFGEDTIAKFSLSKSQIMRQLDRDIAKIDEQVSRQLSAILHHPAFQRLEASWTGLQHLTNCQSNSGDAEIKIQVLNARWIELRNDLEAVEFDQSWFFRKIYDEAIGTPGANPFSTLLMDYEVHPKPSKEHRFNDIEIIREISKTAAAAFAPMYFNASPAMLGVDRFEDIPQTLDIEQTHNRMDFGPWRSFRETEDSRFINLLLPKILLRRPYRPESDFDFGIRYEENPYKHEQHLWGGAIWGMGEVLIRNFAESRWFANIRGVQRGESTGGLVKGPTQEAYTTEPGKIAAKPSTNIAISDAFERQLAKLGLTALCNIKYGSEAAFYSASSTQKPKRYSTAEANANAELSAMSNYILCASRFAHYVKILARDRIGSMIEAEEIRRFLNDWLVSYVNRNPDASAKLRAEKPLIDAQVDVREQPGRPGEYFCVIQLEPYHSFDDVRATLKLDTKLVVKNGRT